MYIGSYLATFRDSLPVPSSRVRQAEKIAGRSRSRRPSVFNYEINYQLDAIEYLFALSSFSSTCFGLTRPSSGAIGVTILTNVAYGVLGFLPGKVSVLRSVCAVGVLHC